MIEVLFGNARRYGIRDAMRVAQAVKSDRIFFSAERFS
jgi:hypothetical protein